METKTIINVTSESFPILEKPVHSHQELLEVARRLKRASQQLDGDLIYLEAQDFYKKIRHHMEEEDSPNGLYHQIEKANPESGRRLKLLRAQHAEILDDLKIILSSDVDFSLSGVSLLVQECLDLVMAHEKEEESLITDVFYSDPTGGE